MITRYRQILFFEQDILFPVSEQIKDVCQNGLDALVKYDFEDEKVSEDGEVKETNWFQQWRK